LLVDVGSKYEGVVKSKDLERVDPAVVKELKVGDEIRVYVVHLADEEGYVNLSLNKALVEKDWEKAQELFGSQDILERRVISTNKGGLIVQFGSVRGFVPGSQLDTAQPGRQDKANQWASLVGQDLSLKIIEVDRRRNRLILSERAAVTELRQQQKIDMLEELSEGQVLENVRVSSLADFGAFVDLGNGAEGLIHLSELSWSQIAHPRDVLKVGETINVSVINIDRARQRIGLSLKRLQPEPWSLVLDMYQPGQIVSAVITKLTSFGAFARIDQLIEGLIHISELSDRQIAHPHEVVQEGQTVDVRIISIEPNRKRMGLSLKQVEAGDLEGDDDEDEAVEAVDEDVNEESELQEA